MSNQKERQARTATRKWGSDEINYGQWMAYDIAKHWVWRGRSEHGATQESGAQLEYWLEDKTETKVY